VLPDLAPLLAPSLADAVPAAALGVLLVVAYRHPPERVEALAGIGCAGVAALAAGLPPQDVWDEGRELGPVVLFLVAILVVAECCRAEGLFEAIGARLARRRSGRGRFRLVFTTAAGTTVSLSLDATAVLLTPVVLAGAPTTDAARPLQLTCVRLANSASLLVPVANLTNLLALQSVDVTFGRFALIMAPPALTVLLVEYGGLRWWFRRELAAEVTPHVGQAPPAPLPRAPLTVVVLMLAGFAVGSAVGVAPFWAAGAAAVVLTTRGLVAGRLRAAEVVRQAHPSFALFVLCLGIVVAALNRAWLGSALANLLPHSANLAGLLVLAALGAFLANLVNNLPATLILAPLVAPLGVDAVLALLVGINVGSSMTWTGSLANLLWRRSVLRSGGEVDGSDLHGTGLALSPAAIVLGVVVLAAWSQVV
jgi:arsenical pump membrane protein